MLKTARRARKRSLAASKGGRRAWRAGQQAAAPIPGRASAALIRGRAERRLIEVTKGSGPVIFGPWLTEIGPEILYWIPLLRWLCERHGLDPARVTVVSRGGTERWYRGLCETYVDVFDHSPPSDVRSWNLASWESTGSQKHRAMHVEETALLDRAGLDAGRATLIHPGDMYDLFLDALDNGRRGRVPLAGVLDRTVYRPFTPANDEPPLEGLPREYVAVKAYYSGAFSDSEANRSFVAELVRRLTKTTDVVLLSTGMAVDDHLDYVSSDMARVYTTEHLMTARTNLAVQTRIVQGARALVSTYGGFSYLAPFLGVTSLAFYAQHKSPNPVHLDVMNRATRALAQAGVDAGFVYLSARDPTLLDWASGLGASAAAIPARHFLEDRPPVSGP